MLRTNEIIAMCSIGVRVVNTSITAIPISAKNGIPWREAENQKSSVGYQLVYELCMLYHAGYLCLNLFMWTLCFSHYTLRLNL